ncbi:MAG: efflux RND transporter periplasmic adaptor subunit, partial [Verrucomicrobia bacterium]|nr:efflux RND transporter periplasmic adaptor subunit [Verrucomicrobiota bacterium]
MNKKSLITLIGTGIVAMLIGLLVGRFLMPSPDYNTSAQHTTSVDGQDESTLWTCSMHPQIQLPEPGACPICGMDLIPLVKGGGGDDGPRTLSMSESSRALADIQTTVLARTYPVEKIHLVGKLEYDETKVKSLTARFPARIDELFVNFTGVEVAEGDDLAKVYSPELLTAQRELLTAHASNPESSIARVAREKLRLWDLLPDQIDAILEHGGASDHFVLRAPVGGVVVSKNVQEGDYIKTGEPLFTIVDLSRLWLYLDAYESDLPWLHYAQNVEFTVEAFPGEIFHGQIAFIEPEVNRKTRTVSVRVNVSNTHKRLKPGMFARGVIEARMADGGKVFAPELAGKWISPMHPEII